MMLLAVAGSAVLRSIAVNAPLLPDVRFAAHYEVGPTLPFPVLMDNPAGARAVLVFYVLMGAMALCSLQLLRTLSSRGNTAVRLFVACAIAITFVMTLWSTLFSVDVYAYVLFGRVYGL